MPAMGTRLGDLARRARIPVLAVVTAFLFGAIVIVLTDFEHLQHLGTDPGGAIEGAIDTMLRGYGALLTGALADPARIATAIQTGNPLDMAAAIRPITETLVIATPFIFVSLGLAVSFHGGLFNFGADGQFLIGGLGAGMAASFTAGLLPPWAALVVGLAGGTLFGAAYAAIAGILKARTGAHEVITTLMLNAMSSDMAFLISGLIGSLLLLVGWIPGPVAIPQVPLIFDLPTVRLDYGLVAALVMAAVVSFLLFRTPLGFEIRATGSSRTAARSAGIQPGRSMALAMTISGGLVGMGSAFFALGQAGGAFGGPARDLGIVALALALIAGRRPAGIVLVAVLYGALTTGAKVMVIETGIPLALLVVIVTLALLLVAAPGLTRAIWRLRAPDPAQADTEAAVPFRPADPLGR